MGRCQGFLEVTRKVESYQGGVGRVENVVHHRCLASFFKEDSEEAVVEGGLNCGEIKDDSGPRSGEGGLSQELNFGDTFRWMLIP